MFLPNGISGVDIGDVTLSGAFTFEGWIYFDPGNPISNDDGFFKNDKNNIHVNFWEGQMRLAAYTGPIRGDVITATTAAVAGEWNHYALTRDADDILRIYVNGQLDAVASQAWDLDLKVDEIGITKRGVTEGALDELRFWDSARSEGQIAAGMNGTLDPQSAGLLGYYQFNDANQVVDSTGTAAPVTVPAGTSIVPSTAPVDQGNQAPQSVDDTASTDLDTAVNISVLANDQDPDGTLDPASVTITSAAGSGTAVVNPDGTVTYTPNGGFQGVDTFTYTVDDDAGDASAPSTVTVTVGTVANQLPSALDDSGNTVVDMPVTLDVLANDSDSDGTLVPGSVAIASGPAFGSVVVNPDGTVTYAPNGGFAGSDSFTYTVEDDDGDASAPSTVDITVATASAGMLKLDGSEGVDIDDVTLSGAFTFEGWIYFDPGNPISNDDGFFKNDKNNIHVNFWEGQMRLAAYTGPIRGDVITATTAAVAGEWNHYALTRDADDILRIYVNGQLDAVASQAWDLDLKVDEIGITKRGVTEGALDELRFWDSARSEGQIAAGMNGTLDPQSAGLLGYYQFNDANQVVDSTGTAAPVTVPAGTSIVPSTAPVDQGNQAPQSVDDTASTDLDTAVNISVLANDQDPDGTLDPASVTITSAAGSGTAVVNPDGTVTYTPNGGFQGVDTFTYTVDDDAGDASAPSTVTVTVGTVANQLPSALDDSGNTVVDMPVTLDVLANDSDSDGTLVPGSVAIASGPAFGSVVVNPDGTVTYAPNGGFAGSDSFTYTVEDDDGDASAPSTVTVTVGTVANQLPSALDDSGNTVVDMPVTLDVLANDSDSDGTLVPGSVAIASGPAFGSVVVNPDGTVTYAPNGGFAGSDSFTYTVEDDDGDASAPSTVDITVATASAGMLKLDGSEGVDIDDVTLSGAFTFEGWIYFDPGNPISNDDGFFKNDKNNIHVNFWEGQMRLAAYTGPIRGDVITATTAAVAGEWNHYALTRDADDILRIYVNGQLDAVASQAWDLDLKVDEIGITKRGVTEGALDELRFWDSARSEGQIAAGMNGTLDPQSAGLLGYYQFNDANQVVDSTGTAAPVTVPAGTSIVPSTAPVDQGNQAPQSVDDTASTDLDTAVNISVLANDQDPDGTLDPASVTITSAAGSGTAVVNPDGTVTYTPNGGFQGVDTFTYTVDDDAGDASAPSTVTVTVGTVANQLPSALDDSGNTVVDMPVTLDVLANDSDSDGTLVPGSVAIASGPAFGSVVVNPDGTVTYAPNGGFAGSDSFTYTVEDDDGDASAPSTVDITVATASAGMLKLDGSEGVDIDDVTLSGAFTFEGWIYFDPGNPISNDDGFFKNDKNNIHVNFWEGQMRLAAYTGPIRGDVITATTAAVAGEWNHYALTRDADDILRIYVNGQLDAVASQAWDLDLKVDEIGITKRGVTEGALDELRFWDSARSEGQIAAGMNGTLDPQSAGLLGYYQFNDANQVVDSTGNADPTTPLPGADLVVSTSPVVPGANLRPAAEPDGPIQTLKDAAILIDVLANDVDLDGSIDPTSVTITQLPGSGSVVVEADGQITYTPAPGFEGLVEFRYTVEDFQGTSSAPTLVTVDVGNAFANAPVVNADFFNLIEDAISVPIAVLYNDVDPQDDPMSIATFTQPLHGALALVDGVLRYTPDLDYTGTDSFSYTATDNNYQSGSADVTLTIVESFTQPQTLIDPKIAPEISPSGLSLVVEKVAKMPLSSTNKQPDINTMAFAGDRIFVGTEGDVDNESRIWELVDNGTGGKDFELFMDIGLVIPMVTGRDLDNSNSRHGGLRGLAFHPEFDDPSADGYGKFYTSIMEDRPASSLGHTYLSDAISPINADSVLVEWTYDFGSDAVDTSSYREVFRIGMPVYDHTIRQISFNPHAESGDEDYGLIYVGHGDGSVQSATAGGGQNSDGLGKIIRVNPLQDGGDSYSVPSTNPFVNDPAMLNEIYALGFRNPAHLSFAEDGDGTSHLIVTTVGRDNFDEVNIVEAGQNYGWGTREGPLVHVQTGGGIVNGVAALPDDDADFGYTYPAAFLAHGGPVGAGFIGRALTGGYVVQNPDSDLNDQFIFAEFATTGRVFHADFSDMLAATTRLDPNDPLRDDPSDLSWVTPSELTVLFDHDNDDATPALVRTSLKDAFDDEVDYEWTYSKGLSRVDVRFGQGPDGELYAMNKANGWVYLVETTAVDDFFV